MSERLEARGRGCTPLRAWTRLGAVGLLVGMMIAPAFWARAESTGNDVVFTGSAAALGAKLTVKVPSAPISDTPVDGGGPTAQVIVDSIGTSNGYAAFPDPGLTYATVPGLITGALYGQGISVPTLPNYPFYIQSDPNSPPQHVGSGPFELSAKSEDRSSTAEATAGFKSSPAGNVAMVSSAASLIQDGKQVVATATSDVQALTVGPLSIGEIKSIAMMKIDEFGTLVPSTNIQITGVAVGGVPVGIDSNGLLAGGATVPVPINETLASILNASGITLEFVAPQRFPDRVIAPALRITFPLQDPSTGTVTFIAGFATASLNDVAQSDGLGDLTPPILSGGVPSGGFTGGDNLGSVPAATTPTGPISSGGSPITTGGGPLAPTTVLAARAGLGQRFDVGGIYLLVVAGALAAVLMLVGRVVGSRGGRGRWVSIDG